MQTRFSAAQLADPDIAAANDVLRACVHCGFCNATCPTYQLTGDELDGPRGRIYLIRQMLEAGDGTDPSAATVTHLDRCLSCLACMATCPASVNYMHLIDIARTRIERSVERPRAERVLRRLIAATIAYPGRFRLALGLAGLARPLARRLGGRVGAIANLAPARVPAATAVQGMAVRPGTVFAAEGPRRKRVALAIGCAQQVLAPQINEATIRVLVRHGVEVVIADGAGCCGSLDHHLGHAEAARAHAKAAIAAWERERQQGGLDAIAVNTAGCGTTIKDYGFIYRNDPDLGAAAHSVAALARDVSELLADLDLTFVEPERATRIDAHSPVGMRIAYHGHCSLQHAQGLRSAPVELLKRAGFEVAVPADAHLCCGSAGSYNLLQPELAASLGRAKAAALAADKPSAIVSGNIGCMTHLAPLSERPIIHFAEAIDWATGGPRPGAL